jgi:hypothetical protein
MNPAGSTVPLADDPARRQRRRRTWLIVAAAAVVMVAGGIGLFVKVTDFVRGMARRPWALLHEAAVATQTEPGAAAFYRDHRGLAQRYASAADFVQASRPWAPKLAKLPPTVPDLRALFKEGGHLNIERAQDRTTFSFVGYGLSVQLVTEDDQLVDLQVQ